MRFNTFFLAVALAAAGALPISAAAQSQPTQAQPTKTVEQGVKITAKVTAIDYKTRSITLQDTQTGGSMQLTAGPEVKRFDDIKVGDTITFLYLESVAMSIVKPGTQMPSDAAATPATPQVLRTSSPNNKPEGMITQEQSTTVTVQSIDMTKPEITVKTQDGRVLSFLVQDKSNLDGVKPGDVVQITYSQALMVSVQ